jgi:hypothetical protein
MEEKCGSDRAQRGEDDLRQNARAMVHLIDDVLQARHHVAVARNGCGFRTKLKLVADRQLRAQSRPTDAA